MKKILLMLALMLPCLGAWAQISSLSDLNNTTTYTIKCVNRGFLYYDSDNAGYVTSSSHTSLVDATPTGAENEQFAFLRTDNTTEGQYYLYSKAAGQFLTYKSGNVALQLTDNPEHAWVVASASWSGNNGFTIKVPETAQTYINITNWQAQKGCKVIGTGVDAGNLMTIKAVDSEANFTAAIAKINQFESPEVEISYTLTDASGNVFTGSFMGHVGVDPVFTGVAGLTLTDQAWDDVNFSATVNFPIKVSSVSTKNQVTISPFQNTSFKYYVTGSDVKTTNSASVTNHLWEIYPSLTNGEFAFQIKNVATGKYISTSLESNTAPAQGNVTVESEGTYFTLESPNQFKVKGKNVYLSTHSSSQSDQYATVWNSHGGTKNTIALIETVNLVTYILTDNAGNTYTTSVEGTIGVDPVFTGVEGYTLSNKSWDGYNFSATIDFNLPFAVSSETTTNLITIGQGTWANAEDGAHTKLWTVVDGNVKVVNGIPTLGTAQWMVYPTLNGTKFGFKIKSASTGKYVTANLASGNDAQAKNTPVTLTAEGTEFSFIGTTCDSDKGFAYTNNNGATMYLTRNGEKDNDALLGVYQASTSHQGSGLRFPEFNQYKVVIGDAGYTTVYSPFTAVTNDPQYNYENYTNGNFVEIYTIADEAEFNEEMNEWKVPLVQASYYVPINGAAILKGNKGTYVFTKADCEIEAIWANNNLKGSSVNTYVAGDAYMLSAPDGVESIGLYPILLNKNAEGADGNTHFLNNAGKAYILAEDLGYPTTPGTTATIRFSFGGETTAIEPVINNGAEANAPIYDLSGRRVVNAVKGGIYIQNGKKVYIK